MATRANGAHSWRTHCLAAVAVVVVSLGLVEARLWRPDVVFDSRHNVQIAEAEAWLNGELHLPQRYWDTAVQDGRVYSHFPILFTAMAASVVPWFHGVPHWFMVLLVVLPLPLCAYVLCWRVTGSPVWGVVLAIGLVCGTSVLPVMRQTLRGGGAYFPNHALAVLGLLILLIELHGRGRVAVAGLGLLMATMARQMTAAFAIPLFWLALRDQRDGSRRGRVITLTLVLVVVAGVPMAVNTLKFGHPLETGYMLIYEGRTDDSYALDAHTHGLFSASFIPRNLWYMNLGFPRLHRIEMAGRPEYHVRPNTQGTGIWWTTPLLIWVFVDFRRLINDPRARSLMIASATVCAALMFFHATGSEQRGYNRFSLDFMPALFCLIRPECFVGRRGWISLGMIAWSVLYFRWLI